MMKQVPTLFLYLIVRVESGEFINRKTPMGILGFIATLFWGILAGIIVAILVMYLINGLMGTPKWLTGIIGAFLLFFLLQHTLPVPPIISRLPRQCLIVDAVRMHAMQAIHVADFFFPHCSALSPAPLYVSSALAKQ